MAAAVDIGGEIQTEKSEATPVLSNHGRWNIGRFVEDMQIGAINGHIGDLHNDVFRIGARKSGVVHQKDVLGHTGCVNAVEFNKTEDMLASGGDDMRVFVWYVSDLMLEEAPKPAVIMERGHNSNIFCYQFSLDGAELFSGGNDGVVLRHDVTTRRPLSVYEERHPVYSISANPIDINIVAASREGGVVSFYDRRETKEGSFCLIDEGQLFRGQYNPANALFFATASNRGVRLYDLRNRKKPLLDLRTLVSEAIYVEWNSTGTALTALQSHSNPIYIDLTEHRRVELKDPEYSNVHTIKSVTFMDDGMVMTGSDDFNIYAWRLPGSGQGKDNNDTVSEATFVLKGHRSIVNHVRYSPSNRIISSCGVEKIIKVWSSLPIPSSYDKPRIRIRKTLLSDITFDESAAVDDTAEDLNMLNYFDQLDNLSRMQAYDPNEDADGDNVVVNVDLEGLRAHLMGLETSDEGSASDGNDYDLEHIRDFGEDGSADDENSARAQRRRRWRMMRRSSYERRASDNNQEEESGSPSRDVLNEPEEMGASSDDEIEGPRKRVRRDTDSTDSSEDEFAVCEGGIPISTWPVRGRDFLLPVWSLLVNVYHGFFEYGMNHSRLYFQGFSTCT
uniref:WD_REPEATS_REGION domain-containing protein n=1 Tax=Haemonchus contortus TaxID=6289 RepID=A0A7I4YV18_HAECO